MEFGLIKARPLEVWAGWIGFPLGGVRRFPPLSPNNFFYLGLGEEYSGITLFTYLLPLFDQGY